MVSRDELAKEYDKLKLKYDLPEFDELNKEFEIFNAFLTYDNVPDFILRTIRRRMVDKFYSWINYLHNFIYANQQSLILMNEFQQFSEQEKQKIIMIINKIMFINRLSVKLEIDNNEEADAHFVKKYFIEWADLKRELVEITNKNIQGWQEAMKKKEQKTQEFFSF